jgi:hypothetical protein
MYLGKGTTPSGQGLGISGEIVIRLVDGIPEHNYKVFWGVDKG